MIKSFKSKALRLLWGKNDSNKLPKQQVRKIRILLQIIDELENSPNDLKDFISLRPHLLQGNLKEFWSLNVTGNYRIIFMFVDGDAYDVDYLDTH
ncbi:MAG: type II toxin-antitoxin system RelE/ParE family toxin [Ginsengibacter sp.]